MSFEHYRYVSRRVFPDHMHTRCSKPTEWKESRALIANPTTVVNHLASERAKLLGYGFHAPQPHTVIPGLKERIHLRTQWLYHPA